LNDVARAVPYLAELGVTDLYLSPIYWARPQSAHGYDIVSHGCIDSDLGRWDGWQRLAEVVGSHSMGIVLDVVPNHMAADPVHNRLWRRLLAEAVRRPAA
jgi:(1->4)-alpha-D-glucan 1-alpha-D-glucosylmutase